MSLLVTGTVGLDTVSTPLGQAENVLGGSAVYFSFAALHYTDVRLVAVVGQDFPPECRAVLAERNIDLRGLETRPGSRTFRWKARYQGDMNQAETLETHLNVLSETGPRVPEEFADSDVVFLANSHPRRQREVLAAVKNPRLTVMDTMNLWIETARDELEETLQVVDGLIVNDAEARALTGGSNLVAAGEALVERGLHFAVIKKGEHGALLACPTGVSAIPAFPLSRVVDPTGAGDSFAGGMLGYLSTQEDFSEAALRRGLVRGTVAASFTIEGFSLERVRALTRAEVDARVHEFQRMLRVE